MTRVEISKRLVLMGSASSVALQVLNITVLLWAQAYLLRRIAPEEYAIYPVVVAVMVFAPMFTELLTGGAARYVVDAYARGEPAGVTRIVSSMLPVLVAGSLVFVAVGGAVTWFVGDLLTIAPSEVGEARWMMGLLVGSTAIEVVLTPFCTGLLIKQRFVLINTIRLLQQLVRVLLLFALLLGVSTQVIWLVVATVAGNLFSLVARAVLSRREVPELRFRARLVDPGTARTMLGFGAWTSLGNLAQMIHSAAPALVLNEMATPVAVNAYHVGTMPHRQMQALVTRAMAPAQPALTAMVSTGRRAQLERTYLTAGRWLLWATLAVAVPLVAFAREAILLYLGKEGPKYIDAAAVLVIVLAAHPFLWANHVLYRVALATAELRRFFLGSIAWQVAGVTAMLVLVGPLGAGAIGAAAATSGVTVVSQVAFFWPLGLAMLRLPFRRFWAETLRPGVTPFVVALAACLLLRAWHAPDTWLELGLAAAGGWAVYLVVLLLCLHPEDVRDLRVVRERVVRRPVPAAANSSEQR